MFPSAAELFTEMPPLESVKALVSLFVSHCQDNAKGKRTLALYDISRAHFHGVPVRRLFVELSEEEKERLARENGHDLEYFGWLRKCICGTVDASARWQSHYAQILKEREFEIFHCSCTLMTSWRRCPLTKRNGSKASCSQSTMESAREVTFGRQHCNGSFVLEPCDPVGSHIWQG